VRQTRAPLGHIGERVDRIRGHHDDARELLRDHVVDDALNDGGVPVDQIEA